MPTYAPDLAAALIGLLRLSRFPQGLLHYCGGQAFSEYTFAQAVLQLEAERNPAFRMPELIPVPSAELHQHRNAPLYCVLDCAKARSLGFTPGSWQKNLAETLAECARANP